MEISGKVAVVTGSAHRLGRVIAVALAEAGAHIVVHYNSASALVDDTVAAIEQHGVRAISVQADLTQPDGPELIIAAAEAEFGGVDILVNSAASMEAGDVLTLEREAWQRVLDLNLTAPFFLAQRAAISMQTRGGGVIINMADMAGMRPWAKYPAHS